MQQGRVAPDVLTFHVASSACNAAAKWRQGAAVLRQLHKTVRCDVLTYHVTRLEIEVIWSDFLQTQKDV